MGNLIEKKQNELASLTEISNLFFESKESELLAKNSMFYLTKEKATITDDAIVLPNKITIDKCEFLQKMYLASRTGLSLIDGDFSFVTFGGGQVVIMPNYRAEIKIAENKGLRIEFVHGKQGDSFDEIGYLKHDFHIAKKQGQFMEINNGQVKNDVIWYGAKATVVSTGETFSYVESTQNILMRANPKYLKFYNDPNAKDTMHEKFVLRQLLKRMPSNLELVDFDKFEGVKFDNNDTIESATIIEDKQIEVPAPKQLKKLEKGSATWEKMVVAIKDHKCTLAAIRKKYDISENEGEILDLFVEAEGMATEEKNEPKNEENTLENMFNQK